MLDIKKLLSQPEGKTLEFKRDLSSIQPILKTLIAFANTAGGILIIGRDDKGNILGIEDIFEAEEKIANSIADNIMPSLMPEIEIISVKGKSLLVVRVTHWRGPFYLKSKGANAGVFIRLGSTNRVAGEELLEELNRTRSKIFFDQQACLETNSNDLDMKKIKQAFASEDRKIDQHKLIGLGVLVEYSQKLVCSNGGVVLFGKDQIRKGLFPNTIVRCARFAGIEKVDFIDQYEVEGTILEAVEEVLKFIRRNTSLGAKIEGPRRKDVPEYSLLIIREVLINALVHADYSIRGMSPRVSIFSNRMEIESPGMLPFGYTLDDFMAGVSRVRNKVITRVFRELKLMEEWGTGYKRIAEACNKENCPIPHWEELGTAIRVTIYPCAAVLEKQVKINPIENKDLTSRQEAILQILQEKDKISAKEIHAKLGSNISERSLRADLLELKRKEFITTGGNGPRTFWKLNL
ncbi:MAG: hypothetical protein K0S74_786 [Chlamydiales bacterium]|jgi:ATP-dependent DNA helicase RecG|nr:hypothetical protein [Chlamydiales bacterium]